MDLEQRYKEEMSNLHKKLSGSVNQTRELQSQLMKKENDLKLAELKISKQTAEKEKLEWDLDIARDQSSIQAKEIAQLKNELEELNSKFSTSAPDNIQQKYAESNAECKKLSSNITKLTNERSDLKLRIENLRQELKNQAEARNKHHRHNLENQRKKLQLSVTQELQAVDQKLKEKDRLLRAMMDRIGPIEQEHEASVQLLLSEMQKTAKESKEYRDRALKYSGYLRNQGFYIAAFMIIEAIVLCWLMG